MSHNVSIVTCITMYLCESISILPCPRIPDISNRDSNKI